MSEKPGLITPEQFNRYVKRPLAVIAAVGAFALGVNHVQGEIENQGENIQEHLQDALDQKTQELKDEMHSISIEDLLDEN